ncbi:MAG: hypothetical protein DRR16_05305 [Candidatus Parabeggiatoa sp. nov. 3]|nr:MAG: hypothetical protein DRQ99_06175 [Gammaproteobacteria bacterium]RKZ88287.1 MAG: hypothetical protein DRR16_05305 [Gammaproteobacteria bacterium]HEW97317.1 hypothetical protein [Beggiatoa sp.]
MNATQTAINVIEWAFNGLGPLPQGDLYDTPALSHPNQALREAMQTLTVIQAAQMYFGSAPFLGDKKPLGVGGALLAAAIGVLHWPESAQQLLKAVPRAHSSADWIIRHALVARVLPLLAEHSGHAVTHLRADLLLVSPLTALVNVPVASQENEMMTLVEQLLEQPASRRWLQLSLAKPTDNRAIRDWRQKILAQLRQTEQDSKTSFVLDVYETLMIHHRSVAFDQVGAARRVLRDPIAAASAQRLQEALSIAQWWQPLWALRRTRKEELRQRLYLDYQYLEGLKLYTLAQRLRGW